MIGVLEVEALPLEAQAFDVVAGGGQEWVDGLDVLLELIDIL